MGSKLRTCRSSVSKNTALSRARLDSAFCRIISIPYILCPCYVHIVPWFCFGELNLFLLSGSSISLLPHSYNHDPAVAFVLVFTLWILPCRHCHGRIITITAILFIILRMWNTTPYAFEFVFAAICGNAHVVKDFDVSILSVYICTCSEIFNHDWLAMFALLISVKESHQLLWLCNQGWQIWKMFYWSCHCRE